MPLPKRIPTSDNLYTPGRQLGAGGCGTVYEVTDAEGTARALKVLDPKKANTQKRARFRNEMAFCARSEHPHIVKVIDRGAFDQGGQDYAFHVTRLYPATLRTRMRQGIPPDKIIEYFVAILDGMRWAHGKGTIHRDLKPENILCGDAIDDTVIADFGCARFVEEEMAVAVATRHDERLANFRYAAPEQTERGGEVTDRTDVYALGLIVHEMFTGEVPRGTSHKTIAKVAPEYAFLDPILDAMRRQTAPERPSMDQVEVQLAAALKNLVSERAVRALETPAPSEFPADPLLDDPVRFIDLDIRPVREFGYSLLIYNLSSQVTGDWVQAFKRPATYRHLDGFDAHKFEFHGNEGRVRIPPRFDVQRHAVELMNSFEQMLANANGAYRQMVMSRRQAHERHRQEDRQHAIEAERVRQGLRNAMLSRR